MSTKKANTSREQTATRPGTAVHSKGKQRAGEILEAARAVLVDAGYASLTTRKVAERAGIRQSNVQYYFPTKVDLVQALFERAMETQMEALAERMASGSMTPKRRMLWMLDRHLQGHEDPEQVRFMRELWALAAHDPEVARLMDNFYSQWVDVAAENLLEVNPELGKRRAQRRALEIVALVDGISLFQGAYKLDHAAVQGIRKEIRETVIKLATEI